MEFLRQEYWSELSFPLPMDHNMSELSNMTDPSSVGLHGVDHSLVELCKCLHHDKAVIHEGGRQHGTGYVNLLKQLNYIGTSPEIEITTWSS